MSEYINKDETIKILERMRDRCGNVDMAFALNWAADSVKIISTADVEEVKHGKWSRHEDCFEYEYYRCSVCGDEFYLYDGDPINNHYFYCPNCGAKMDKEKEE